MTDQPTATVDTDGEFRDEGDDVDVSRIILAMSLEKPRATGLRVRLGGTQNVIVGRGPERRVRAASATTQVTVDDDGLSRSHMSLHKQNGGWELRDLDSKNGTFVNGVRRHSLLLEDGDTIEAGNSIFIFRSVTLRALSTDTELCQDRGFSQNDLGVMPAFRTLECSFERQLRALQMVAPARVPILLRGATGTGKDVIARAIHEMSGRSGVFVAINCGALPPTLIESELFGHRRGAFSGAYKDRAGLVLKASGGTLFLDEVAELPIGSQAVLLRILQDGELRPIGSVDSTRVDLRVVAATHQDLEKRIASGLFRQDLYARLTAFEIQLPTLKERREDIGNLVATFLADCDVTSTLTIHRLAARALLAYNFPLNIRELEQTIRTAVTLSGGRQIRLEHLPEAMRCLSANHIVCELSLRERLRSVLAENRGNITATARVFNKAPTQIRRWCERFEIDIKSFRDFP